MNLFSVLLLSALLVQFSSFAQNKSKPANTIRPYWFVLLTRGAHRSQDSAMARQLQEGHMANIRRLYQTGRLKVAGPFGDEGNWRGIFIFDQSADSCGIREMMEPLLQSYPAIAAARRITAPGMQRSIPAPAFPLLQTDVRNLHPKIPACFI